MVVLTTSPVNPSAEQLASIAVSAQQAAQSVNQQAASAMASLPRSVVLSPTPVSGFQVSPQGSQISQIKSWQAKALGNISQQEAAEESSLIAQPLSTSKETVMYSGLTPDEYNLIRQGYSIDEVNRRRAVAGETQAEEQFAAEEKAATVGLVKVAGNKYLTQDQWNSLSSSDQALIQKIGVNQFNNVLTQRQVQADLNASVEENVSKQFQKDYFPIADGKYLPISYKDTWNSLDTRQQKEFISTGTFAPTAAQVEAHTVVAIKTADGSAVSMSQSQLNKMSDWDKATLYFGRAPKLEEYEAFKGATGPQYPGSGALTTTSTVLKAVGKGEGGFLGGAERIAGDVVGGLESAYNWLVGKSRAAVSPIVGKPEWQVKQEDVIGDYAAHMYPQDTGFWGNVAKASLVSEEMLGFPVVRGMSPLSTVKVTGADWGWSALNAALLAAPLAKPLGGAIGEAAESGITKFAGVTGVDLYPALDTIRSIPTSLASIPKGVAGELGEATGRAIEPGISAIRSSDVYSLLKTNAIDIWKTPKLETSGITGTLGGPRTVGGYFSLAKSLPEVESGKPMGEMYTYLQAGGTKGLPVGPGLTGIGDIKTYLSTKGMGLPEGYKVLGQAGEDVVPSEIGKLLGKKTLETESMEGVLPGFTEEQVPVTSPLSKGFIPAIGDIDLSVPGYRAGYTQESVIPGGIEGIKGEIPPAKIEINPEVSSLSSKWQSLAETSKVSKVPLSKVPENWYIIKSVGPLSKTGFTESGWEGISLVKDIPTTGLSIAGRIGGGIETVVKPLVSGDLGTGFGTLVKPVEGSTASLDTLWNISLKGLGEGATSLLSPSLGLLGIGKALVSTETPIAIPSQGISPVSSPKVISQPGISVINQPSVQTASQANLQYLQETFGLTDNQVQILNQNLTAAQVNSLVQNQNLSKTDLQNLVDTLTQTQTKTQTQTQTQTQLKTEVLPQTRLQEKISEEETSEKGGGKFWLPGPATSPSQEQKYPKKRPVSKRRQPILAPYPGKMPGLTLHMPNPLGVVIEPLSPRPVQLSHRITLRKSRRYPMAGMEVIRA